MRGMFDSLGGLSGIIDRELLKRGLRSKYSVGIGLEPAVDAMLNEIDQNDDGQISFEEFSAAFAPRKHKKYRRKQSVFDGPKMGWQRLDKIVQEMQYDMIYHEHTSYHHLSPLLKVLPKYNLNVFDAEIVPTHGGSLRVYCTKSDIKISKSLEFLIS